MKTVHCLISEHLRKIGVAKDPVCECDGSELYERLIKVEISSLMNSRSFLATSNRKDLKGLFNFYNIIKLICIP